MKTMENNTALLENEKKEANYIGFLKRIISVIFSPKELFASLENRPRLLFPLLSMILAGPLFYLARFSLYKEMLQESMQIALESQGTQVTPEQLESASKFGPIFGLIGAPIGALLVWVISAAVIFMFVKIFKGKGCFKQYLSVVGYSYVIMIAYFMLSAIVSFFSGTLILDSSFALVSNLIYPDLKGTYIYGIIRGIDLFQVWMYFVISIGVVVVSKLSSKKVIPFVFIFW